MQASLTLFGGGNNNGGGTGGDPPTEPPDDGQVSMTKQEFATRLSSLVDEAGKTGLDNVSMASALQSQAQALQPTQ